MKRVFVDSGGFFAALVSEDGEHARIKALFQQAAAERWLFVTTNAVVFETQALLLNRSRDGRNNALAFLDLLERDDYVVERILASDEKRGIEIFRSHADKSYSLCDATSFAVMERLGITEAIAPDRHFREIGRFTIL